MDQCYRMQILINLQPYSKQPAYGLLTKSTACVCPSVKVKSLVSELDLPHDMEALLGNNIQYLCFQVTDIHHHSWKMMRRCTHTNTHTHQHTHTPTHTNTQSAVCHWSWLRDFCMSEIRLMDFSDTGYLSHCFTHTLSHTYTNTLPHTHTHTSSYLQYTHTQTRWFMASLFLERPLQHPCNTHLHHMHTHTQSHNQVWSHRRSHPATLSRSSTGRAAQSSRADCITLMLAPHLIHLHQVPIVTVQFHKDI